jgi:hypothetical protein
MGPSAAASDPYGFWIPLSDPREHHLALLADRFVLRNTEHGVDLGEPGRIGEGSWDEYAWWGDHPGGAKGYKDKAALVALAEARFAALPEVFHTSKGRPVWWPKLKSVIIVDQAQEMLRYAAKGPRDEWGRPIGR